MAETRSGARSGQRRRRGMNEGDSKSVRLAASGGRSAAPQRAGTALLLYRRVCISHPRRMDDLPAFFDRAEPVAELSGNLPHWPQDGVIYFVTFRLGDSLPQSKIRQWKAEREAWLGQHSEPPDDRARAEYHRLFVARVHRWLDAGYGSCILQEPTARDVVECALRHFDGGRYRLGEHVIMPNHVHAPVTPFGSHELSEILHTWKSFTAHQLKKLFPSEGGVWQKESFDHIVRSPQQLDRIEQYIRDNPKRKPK